MTASRLINVFIVDDSAVMREAIRDILSLDDGLVVAGEADSVASALNGLKGHEEMVVLVDISLGGVDDGLGLIRELAKGKRLKIIAISAHSGDEFALNCRQAGADQFVSKDDLLGELAGAIRSLSGPA